ncbi:hypothetical protein LTR86_005662 [Recurvomyces mirabilis]|nr:hypothetical protein LTR86_005662 [Recurvomyces mirabilis]
MASLQGDAVLERRVVLLRAILDTFASAAAKRYEHAKVARHPTKIRMFWGDITQQYQLILEGQWSRLCPKNNELLIGLLGALESIVRSGTVSIAEECINAAFPHLETLRQIINGVLANDTAGLFHLLRALDEQPAQLSRTNVIEHLRQLADVLTGEEQQSIEAESTVFPQVRRRLAPFLLNMLSVVSNHWTCKCALPHRAALFMCTHRHVAEEDTTVTIHGLLSTKVNEIGWHATSMNVDTKRSQVRTRFDLPASTSIPTRRKIRDLCSTIESSATQTLKLDLDGRKLFQLMSSAEDNSSPPNMKLVSLANGLFALQETELGIAGKLCLCIVLSYSILDFCGEPWFPAGWTKSGIHFFQDDKVLRLRPMLVTPVQPARDTLSTSSVAMSSLLLSHAALMMEIYRQSPFSKDEVTRAAEDRSTYRAFLRSSLQNMNWDVHERFKQAVQSCLDISEMEWVYGDAEVEGRLDSAFCQRVIGMLLSDFNAICGAIEPDVFISSLCLPRVESSSDNSKTPQLSVEARPRIDSRVTRPRPSPKPAHLRAHSPWKAISRRPAFESRESGRSTGSNSGPSYERFFDTDEVVSVEQIRESGLWFQRFDEVKAKMPRMTASSHQLKIAILDTGIDLENAWVSCNARRIRCWPDAGSCKDTDGHGTDVAYLLLRLAPENVHIRVAKIAQSRFLRTVDISAIAKAIEHFSDHQGEKVDIINLSFGFATYKTPELRAIWSAIRYARDNGVLIFAAAGNEGANDGVAWPAKLPDVVCVSATDSYGRPAGFSSGEGHRVCTMGVSTPTCRTDDKQEIIHRSGTSFSTPVAVAIAATVLAFMEGLGNEQGLLVPQDCEDLKSRLWTKTGMERVLCRTCVPSESSGHRLSYITHVPFLTMSAFCRLGIILNELRSVPEG